MNQLKPQDTLFFTATRNICYKILWRHCFACRQMEVFAVVSELPKKTRPLLVTADADCTRATQITAGVTDHVRCFACDGGLRNWEEGEDPWIEHCRWFPACPFVRGTKGDEFIALIQTINKEENKEHSEDIQTSGNANITPSSSHLQEHRRTCTVECGISEEEFAEALLQLRASGHQNPQLDDLINEIEKLQRQKFTEQVPQETDDSILMENARLNRILKCYQCKVNDVNALFLPCAHHRMCMECVIKYDVTLCPVCDWKILEIELWSCYEIKGSTIEPSSYAMTMSRLEQETNSKKAYWVRTLA
ncbi:BIR7A-like protein [Mya arenaria]|uniref:BIR7A-like protein n=1 Tax=Mya arenaria TaxID=6604 RepID=A0ABY7EHT2_MYAAR|nr:BIR7A-like protein [Mya arenaria]